MDKAYHPSYTSMNPASEARRYTSQSIRYRKVTQIYDWLDPERDVASWVRWVPYRLENGDEEHSWIVKYFEFRAGIPPIPQVGFIGDLWVSHNAGDPSVWFKVDQMEWERWGGCASSARGVSFFFVFSVQVPLLSLLPFFSLSLSSRVGCFRAYGHW